MMTERDFVYWLQGFFEMSNATMMDEQQVSLVKERLSLVFNKATSEFDITKVDNERHAAIFAGRVGITHCGSPMNEETRQGVGDVTCERCKLLESLFPPVRI